ncbi:CDP-alcohol phosphatidyltransferase family protein [Nocardioides mesophilus]|uniref:CDP-alcohol phosphatidyltransferase family protein n=1 Tax=Nocardioides mesophilus TaxID=433659 RepID=A0A7G9RCQ4_9ACTN|nr:CDP-alcohol phosphatidyltransferase family protein [Nocardioides mesophilus]QNN53379.1 CDP-alcohol phosphatidyltransferase family protein [Nocardioides mesophilus]
MTATESAGAPEADVWTDPAAERIATSATVVTAVRTVASVALAGVAAREGSLTLLVVALVVYWVGDMADGLVARVRGCETRIGAVLDILSDRFCAAAFYLGLMWLQPEMAAPVLVYLAEFMVVDCFLSLAFLAWAVRSPNYFYVIDRPLWLWNWSKPGKAVNSALFAVILLVTGMPWLGLVIALALLGLKCASLVRLARIGLPVPAR